MAKIEVDENAATRIDARRALVLLQTAREADGRLAAHDIDELQTITLRLARYVLERP